MEEGLFRRRAGLLEKHHTMDKELSRSRAYRDVSKVKVGFFKFDCLTYLVM